MGHCGRQLHERQSRLRWLAPRVIYQHPLAYLLGLEGIALLRAWAGDFDEAFVEARLREVRALLEDERLTSHPGVHVWPGDVETGYRQWASTYDGEPRNGLFDIEEPVMHEILDALPAGRAVDAACGTGRYTAHLADKGHAVVGVDNSADMLAVARARLPHSDFLAGSLDNLPMPDNSADLIVCALALAHVPELGVVMAEFARVLRLRGHLVISDAHHELIFRGSVVRALTATGEPGLAATYPHTPGDFLRAALPVGFQVCCCEEPRGSRSHDEPAPSPVTPTDVPLGTWHDWPWTLLPVIPDAARAAWATPSVVIWDFELRPIGPTAKSSR
jgi:SAM-dependent methyltransferase